MAVHLYLAPAGAGKTSYLLEQVRSMASELAATPRACLASLLQVRSWRRRLAQTGGAIGVQILTFDRLYSACLNAAGEVYTELSEPVQYRLLRSIVDDLPLEHYQPLVNRPGFVYVLQRLIAELKAARVWPHLFADAVAAMGDPPRLRELAQLYAAYQDRLQAHRWADRAGLGWLAVESLEQRAPHVGRDWPLLAVDGFDNLTPVQLALLRVLTGRVGELIVTLTGPASPETQGRPVFGRFNDTRQRLEKALEVTAEPLPQKRKGRGWLAHLESTLFGEEAPAQDLPVELVAAPDRSGEVRVALRWLKARLIEEDMAPAEVALLARDITPYRPIIRHTAKEFGLPIRLVDGLPLRSNPTVAALLDLLRLMMPRGEEQQRPALPHRLVVEAWRSPYFDWSAFPAPDARQPIGIRPGDADALDAVARWGQVIGGEEQWEEVLRDLAAAGDPAAKAGTAVQSGPSAAVVEPGATFDEERERPADLPTGTEARRLWQTLRRFIRRLTPPAAPASYRDYVRWLEALIGPDPALASSRYTPEPEPTALQVVARARDGAEEVAERDVAALQALKDILRGLVWAEEAVRSTAAGIDFARFFTDLSGAIESATYRLPFRPEREQILVADVVQARGVPFRAVALLGLAEGQFPTRLQEDPFLRDADRAHLAQQFGLAIEPSTASAEVEFFYEAVTRPWERLLLTRPRLAEGGVPWQPSPFWEEILRRVTAEPTRLTGADSPTPDRTASWPELIESLVAHPQEKSARRWARRENPNRWTHLERAAQIARLRVQAVADSAFDGALAELADSFSDQFGPHHTWSASRLESYRTCPYLFFVGSVLGLEPRLAPEEGLDARQLGTIYHRLFERLYESLPAGKQGELDALLEALPAVAAQILDEAPRREGFRATAWWTQTREEIVENVARSLEALHETEGAFHPYRHEAPFGLEGQPPLKVGAGGDELRLRGYIDRLDRNPAGELRVIDYKTSSPNGFGRIDVARGKKLQLPLYALAAWKGLKLGKPVEGFYWHVRQAERSGFTLSGFPGGPDAAYRTALEKAWEAVHGARRGDFAPRPPDKGCPSYCPAAAFCWHYSPGFGGG